MYLEAVVGDVDAAGEAAALGRGAAFADGDAVPAVVHHVERVAVSGVCDESKTDGSLKENGLKRGKTTIFNMPVTLILSN